MSNAFSMFDVNGQHCSIVLETTSHAHSNQWCNLSAVFILIFLYTMYSVSRSPLKNSSLHCSHLFISNDVIDELITSTNNLHQQKC